MLNQSTAKGIRLGIAVFLASFAGQALADTYIYDGVAGICTDTCEGFDALASGSVLEGGLDIDAGASDTFTFADIGDFSFLVLDPATPIEPYDGSNPTAANPLPVNPAVAVIRAVDPLGAFTTGGTTDADGELDSGTLLIEFTVPPFSSNSAWVVINLGTGQAKVCLFFATLGCLPGATETVVIDGGFLLANQGSLEQYTQNFDGLDIGSATALTDDGWKAFGNVFDSEGVFDFGYGPFGAPNGGPGFSGIVDDQGGEPQGTQQLSIYNDYNCCEPASGHINGTDLVESNVYQEQIVGLGDVGETWYFSFDAKLGDLAGDTTALAFIKTLDPDFGFALRNFNTEDTTAISVDWMRYDISIAIDASMIGQLLQVGFASTASNYEASQVVYDNINFSLLDSDADGAIDSVDNCTFTANPDQADTNGDGIGNRCDADFDQSCFVNFSDLDLMKANFFMPSPDYDLDGSGFVNFSDLDIMKSLFFQPPGPSATACVPEL